MQKGQQLTPQRFMVAVLYEEGGLGVPGDPPAHLR